MARMWNCLKGACTLSSIFHVRRLLITTHSAQITEVQLFFSYLVSLVLGLGLERNLLDELIIIPTSRLFDATHIWVLSYWNETGITAQTLPKMQTFLNKLLTRDVNWWVIQRFKQLIAAQPTFLTFCNTFYAVLYSPGLNCLLNKINPICSEM